MWGVEGLDGVVGLWVVCRLFSIGCGDLWIRLVGL